MIFPDDDIIISRYTRAEAIADGTLVDLSALFPELLRELGFKLPVACTATVFEECIRVENSPGAKRMGCDLTGRTWDALWMARCAIRAASREASSVDFKLLALDERATQTLLRVLRRRESLGSTGVGRGVAIPHCRSLVASRLRLAFGRHKAGLEYGAIDDRPVRFFFLIVAPPLEISNQYLPVLGRIAQFAKEPDVPDRLATLTDPADFFTLLDEKKV